MPTKDSEYIYSYTKANYDTIKILTPKGTRAKLKATAEKRGISVNALLNEIIAQILPADPPEPDGQIPGDAEPEPRQLPED